MNSKFILFKQRNSSFAANIQNNNKARLNDLLGYCYRFSRNIPVAYQLQLVTPCLIGTVSQAHAYNIDSYETRRM